MTQADLDQIEQALGVRLPQTYCSLMRVLPSGRYGGYSLHEDATMIVERTKAQRAGYAGRPPWPWQYVYIGDEDDACPYALDCKSGSVTYTDHGDLEWPLAHFASVGEFVDSLSHAQS